MSEIEELKELIKAQSKEISDVNKKLTFMQITVDSIEKKVSKLMEWTLADQDGVDYTKK